MKFVVTIVSMTCYSSYEEKSPDHAEQSLSLQDYDC